MGEMTTKIRSSGKMAELDPRQKQAWAEQIQAKVTNMKEKSLIHSL